MKTRVVHVSDNVPGAVYIGEHDRKEALVAAVDAHGWGHELRYDSTAGGDLYWAYICPEHNSSVTPKAEETR